MTTTNPALADGLALEKAVLDKFKTAIDGAFGDSSATVPKLVGDEVAFAESWLKSHLTGYPLTVFDGVLAFGGTQINQAVSQLSTLAQAQIGDVQKTVDAKLSAIGA